MTVSPARMRQVEINGGQVSATSERSCRLFLPATRRGYADAQIDDYGGRYRSNYPWQPGTVLSLDARFSHAKGQLLGTAGFGFWNAPFGPGTGPLPALPQATWFFYGSAPNDLPLAPPGAAGRGWFASTLDAGPAHSLPWAPLAPLLLLAYQFPTLRRRLWPPVQRSLRISFRQIPLDLTEWHHYELSWQSHGSFFNVNGHPLLQTPFRPRGPLGFVCWIDNQYMVARPNGRFSWGTLETQQEQWLDIRNLVIER